MVVAHSFSLSSQDTEAGRSLEFQASLVYIVSYTEEPLRNNNNKGARTVVFCRNCSI